MVITRWPVDGSQPQDPGWVHEDGDQTMSSTRTTMVATTGSAMVYTLSWIAPLVALKATTCIIQGVVYSRLLTVYSEEVVSSR